MKIVTIAPLLLLAACMQAPYGGGERPARSPEMIATSTGMLVRLEEGGPGDARIIDADPESVWYVMPEAFDALGIDGAGIIDPEAMTFGAPRFTGTRIAGQRTASFVRCTATASGPSGVGTYRTRLSISTRVEPAAEGGTRLVTSVAGTATTVEGTSTPPVRCVTTGQLEELIATVAARLATRR